MTNSRTLLIGLAVAFVGGWSSYSLLTYLTHKTPPKVQLVGLEHEGYVKGVVQCALRGSSTYKVSHMNLYIDGQPLDLDEAKNIGAKEFDRPFKLDTVALADGKHTLEVEAFDTSYRCNKSRERWDFHIDNKPLKVSFLQPDYTIDQGRTGHVQLQANKALHKAEVVYRGKTYKCLPDTEFSKIYECYIPTSCEDQPSEYLLSANLCDAVKNQHELTTKLFLKESEFVRARGFSVAKGKLASEREASRSNKLLDEALEQCLSNSPEEKLWAGAFSLPLDVKRVTTPFGELRTTPEKGRYHHAAVDLIGTPKCVVWASEQGKVIIMDRFFHSGNTVVLDHGRGVFSMYFHLNDFSEDISVGEIIKKGVPLGRMGMTGYASGAHVHWEMRIDNQPVDPMQWTEKIF